MFLKSRGGNNTAQIIFGDEHYYLRTQIRKGYP